MATETTKITYVEGAAASTPAANRVVTYPKADGLMYSKDDAGTETLMSSGPAGSGIAATIFDAKGDLIGASAADTAARLAASGTNDLILAAASGETTGLQWQARSKFKYTTRNGAGNYTTASTSKTPIDATNLAYLTFTLAVNDVVRCTFAGQTYNDGTNVAGFDFEVDQPTSGNVYIGNANDYGVTEQQTTTRTPVTAVGMFIATEAGVHGFRPVWLVNAGTQTLCNAASGADDTQINFIVEKLGPSS